jgi:hypothetical protein
LPVYTLIDFKHRFKVSVFSVFPNSHDYILEGMDLILGYKTIAFEKDIAQNEVH